jgi:hypothetical protein
MSEVGYQPMPKGEYLKECDSLIANKFEIAKSRNKEYDGNLKVSSSQKGRSKLL